MTSDYRKTQLRAELDCEISRHRHNPVFLISSLGNIQRMIRELEDLGDDVSSYEMQFSEIVDNVLVEDIRCNLGFYERDLTIGRIVFPIAETEQMIRQAAEFGADVSEFEAVLPEFRKKIILEEIESDIRFHEDFSSFAFTHIPVSSIEEKLREAQGMGADIDGLEERFLKIKRNSLLIGIREKLRSDEKRLLDPMLFAKELSELIKRAEEIGADVSEFDGIVPKIKRTEIKKYIEKLKARIT